MITDKLCPECGRYVTEIDDGLYECEYCEHISDTSYWQRGLNVLAAEGKTLGDLMREMTEIERGAAANDGEE